MYRYLCIVAGQRAGTTALHSALASTGKFANYREIFHTDPDESPGTFLKFCKTRDVRIADLASGDQALRISLDYLGYLRNLSNKQVPILDIKLNSWHVIKPFWSYVHEMPFFMKVLIKERCLFLFIRRRALSDQIISEQIARWTDKWHNLEDGDVAAKVHVNLSEVIGQARLILQSEAFILECLEGIDGFVGIEYEDLFPNGSVNPQLLRLLQEKLGITLPASLIPTIRKNLPDKSRIVANFSEVSAAINNLLQHYPRAPISNQII